MINCSVTKLVIILQKLHIKVKDLKIFFQSLLFFKFYLENIASISKINGVVLEFKFFFKYSFFILILGKIVNKI